MTAALRADDAVMAEINVTPFTDVLLVLLIIFMILVAVVAPPGFERQLPNSGEPPPRTTAVRTIEVVISERDAIFVDGRPSSAARVYADLADTVRRRGRLHVALSADVKASYGTIIRILDAAKIVGLDDVGFVTS
ncbi:MAG TPA: biopolymer transporter ExbD [Candidatus Limnocylindrales bacterium]|nr:biopolymer transporter ExbD [Candidatus Limnocylindrales bacterium]